MAWTTPTTQNPGDAILASLWNTQVKDNLLEFDDLFTSDWTSWNTYTLTNVNLGSTGTKTGRYIKIGTFVAFWTISLFGGTGISVTAPVSMSLPFSASNNQTGMWEMSFLDSGVNWFTGQGIYDGGALTVYAIGTNTNYAQVANLSATVPFTWSAGDTILVSGIYEAATP